ncbi:hypothetical protein [Bacteroides sp. Marseille-P3684]|uniref:hypothetical protein n=1 Tax=Bacteroides sp. Marseille-P3684 TaxID=2086579 RepID=UPI00130091E4|nr:hypothetical protein [Bacteroides sp. Marseille-P3684]
MQNNSSKNEVSALLLERRCLEFFFAVLFSLHRRTKQYCFIGQTILFQESNTCVWKLKQYCFAHEKEVFEVNKYKTNRRCRSFLLIGFSFCPLEGGVFQKYALAENDESGNCVRETACLPLRLSMGEEGVACSVPMGAAVSVLICKTSFTINLLSLPLSSNKTINKGKLLVPIKEEPGK